MMSGEKTYTAERICKRGHYGPKNTASGSCLPCKKVLDAVYIANNREQYNARKQTERVKHLPALAEKMRVRRKSESPVKRDIRLAYARAQQNEWRASNVGRASIRKAKNEYKARNLPKVRADTAKRRAAILRRTPKWLSKDMLWMIEQAYELAFLRTKMFGFAWHVDHIVPLQGKLVSGLHVPANLQVIPEMVNLRKSNKFLPV
jgi:hypothetical protein